MSHHDSYEPRFPAEDLRPQGQLAPTALHDHERKDIPLAGVLWFAVILALIGVGVQLLLAFWIGFFSRGEERAIRSAPPRFADATDLYPTPRVQGDPNADMQQFSASEAQALASYGTWRPLSPDDPASARVVRLPIDRAINLVVQKARGTVSPASTPASDTPEPAPRPAAEAKAKPE